MSDDDLNIKLEKLFLKFNKLYDDGKLAKTIETAEEIREITIKVSDLNDVKIAKNLLFLANFYDLLGRYDHSEPLFFEAKKIFSKFMDDNNPKLTKHDDVKNYCKCLCDLGVHYINSGLLIEAEHYLFQSKGVIEFYFGKNHLSYAFTAMNMAEVYRHTAAFVSVDRINEAQRLLSEAKEIIGRICGKDHPNYGTILNNSANYFKQIGHYGEAEQLYREAKDICYNFFGEDHHRYAQSLNNIALLYQDTERALESFNLMMKVFFIDMKSLSDVFSISSEKQRSEFLKTLNFSIDRFLSLIVGPLKDNINAKDFAAEVVLSWKGLEMETSMAEKEITLAGEYPELADKIQELRVLRDQYVQFILADRNNQSSGDYQESFNEFKNRIEALESDLARNIPEMNLKKRLEKIDSNIITSNIPRGAVLIDFIRYDYYRQDKSSESCYLAFVLNPKESDNVVMIDLGNSEIIDKEIMALRRKITWEVNFRGLNEDKISSTVSEVSNKLECLVLEPIFKVISDDCDILFVSPDGDLSLLPFEIIPYNEGLLMDYYDINYLCTGRDLIRLNQELCECSNPVIMVDPDFDFHKEHKTGTVSNMYSNLSHDDDNSNLYFSPLPGTRIEGEKISNLLDSYDHNVWMGHEAVETRLKTLKSPWILHLATHGFFLPDQVSPTSDYEERTSDLRFTSPGIENPLIRSGLAFSGANIHFNDLSEDSEDGIFTAEEACGLNLLNTELVVLSACETGLGEVKRGEGVFGLRRAFVLAGARTLVMSLWKVDDLATTILMERFYQNMIQKDMGRNKALKEAQKYVKNLRISDLRNVWLSEEHISKFPKDLQEYLNDLSTFPDYHKPFEHPYYWGAFICQGDPSPLTKRIF